jgi:MFS family permease
MNSIAMQTGSILGPALSGLVIAYKGLEYAYLFNMISYGAVLLALILMGRIQQQSSPISESQKRRQGISLEAIREGVQFILSQPIILSTMVIDFFATFFSSANTLMPIVAVDVLGVGEVEYGFLSSAQSVGALLAALWLSQMELIHHQGKTFLRAVFFFGLATVVFGLSRSYWLSLMALMAIGASDSVSTVIRNTIRQLQTPDYIRGRMTSINQIFFMGGPQLGELEAGIVAQAFGAPVAIITGGIGCILALYATIRRWPHLQQYDGSKPEALATPAD